MKSDAVQSVQSVIDAVLVRHAHKGMAGPYSLSANELDAILAERQEMLQLLANGLSDAEGWSAKDEARAAELVKQL